MGKRIFCTVPCIILSVFLLKNGTMNRAPAAMETAMPPYSKRDGSKRDSMKMARPNTAPYSVFSVSIGFVSRCLLRHSARGTKGAAGVSFSRVRRSARLSGEAMQRKHMPRRVGRLLMAK